MARTMPFVEVKSIRGVFSAEEKASVIEELTNVFGRLVLATS